MNLAYQGVSLLFSTIWWWNQRRAGPFCVYLQQRRPLSNGQNLEMKTAIERIWGGIGWLSEWVNRWYEAKLSSSDFKRPLEWIRLSIMWAMINLNKLLLKDHWRQCDQIGRFLDFGQFFKDFGNNLFVQIYHILMQFLLRYQNLSFF